MCLGVPGKVVEIDMASADTLLMGTVDFSGSRLAVCLAYVPETEIGQHVLVHAGFALAILDEDLAAEKLAALRQLDEALHGVVQAFRSVVDLRPPAIELLP